MPHSAFVLADVLVTSLRKLLILLIKNSIYKIKVQKRSYVIFKTQITMSYRTYEPETYERHVMHVFRCIDYITPKMYFQVGVKIFQG